MELPVWVEISKMKLAFGRTDQSLIF
jgi:hypothetical protein